MKLALFLLGTLASALHAQSPSTLWYRQPAKLWTDALPVGNGRMGAMVFGGIDRERIQFNESTVWQGAPHDYAHKGASGRLAKIRELLWAGQQKEAEELALREFMSVPLRQKAYQALGDLELEIPGVVAAEAQGYRRELDLDTGIATVQYTIRGTTYRREVFASYPANVVVVRITGGKPAPRLKAAHDATVTADSISGGVAGGAIRFEAKYLSLADSGGVTLILAAATNYLNYKDVSADPRGRVETTLAAARKKGYAALRAEHLADHQKLFRRVTIDLGRSASEQLPTDERIVKFAGSSDPSLVSLVFQFGRYLLIGSSRPGGQPATLQGLWNESNAPSWDSKYTININTEMNYWPAGPANLSECELPLFDALKDLAAAGAVTAKEHYNAGGWVVHHNFDLWRGTAPINNSNHGIWQTGGAWLSTHLWEHYLYTLDKRFLRETAYPLMKGAAQFFVESMVKDPKTGRLIVGPSNSPEQGGLVMGPTMDHQIVRSLFGETIAAAKTLGVDAELRDKLAGLREQIAPNLIGKHGQLQEWLEDKDDPKNQHRHQSHLWGAHPGSEITEYGTPDLFKAAQQSLLYRGDAATGWSMGWKLNLWARFLDGDHAYKILQNLITPASDGRPAKAGLYANLFDAHPPFQIDGNFGATAGIAEMLVQSHDPHGTPTSLTAVQSGEAAFVHLLPALPSAFPSGKVTGLRARGGLGVDVEWKGGKLVAATLTATAAIPVRVRYAAKEVEVRLKAGERYKVGAGL